MCPVCGHRAHFRPYGQVKRQRAQCPRCESLERHRLLYLYLSRKTDLFHRPQSVLHFAPSPGLEKRFRAAPRLEYVTADLFEKADVKLDISAIELPAQSVDVVIAYHVLEHVPADRRAMAELYRILKPGGRAFVQVPLSPHRPETYENPAITTPAGRKKHFGQVDHVRLYGWKDFRRRLEGAGFRVEVSRFVESLPKAQQREWGVDPRERIWILTRPLRGKVLRRLAP